MPFALQLINQSINQSIYQSIYLPLLLKIRLQKSMLKKEEGWRESPKETIGRMSKRRPHEQVFTMTRFFDKFCFARVDAGKNVCFFQVSPWNVSLLKSGHANFSTCQAKMGYFSRPHEQMKLAKENLSRWTLARVDDALFSEWSHKVHHSNIESR